jgi:lipopolysaccharide/colanic/teichoic acid biosynthesis glycosyltransferase
MLKRLMDLSIALLLLVALSAPMLITALAVAATMGRPVLFRQLRPGLGGRPFELMKFRTMTADVDGTGTPLADEARLTATGRWLRRLSLDELPQLINVVRGEMSLVGPRPLLMEYLPLYTAEQARRHEVRPGITGWAQVNGRNAISWEERFALDVWYVEHRSLWLDLRILGLTLLRVLRAEGISQPGAATMARFTGSGRGG